MEDTRQSEANNELLLLLTQQDNQILVFSAIALCTTGPILILTIIALWLLIYIQLRFQAAENHLTSIEAHLSVPKRTYLMAYKKEVGFLSKFLINRDDAATLSIPLINIIYCPDRFKSGLWTKSKEAVLLHEFGHCNRYDLTFLFLGVVFSIKFIFLPLQYLIVIPDYYQNNTGLLQALGFLLGISTLIAAQRIFQRREHIADFYAWTHNKQLFSGFIVSQLQESDQSIDDCDRPTRKFSKIRNFFRGKWHPSLKNRLDILKGEKAISPYIFTYTFFWSFTLTMLAIYIALPRGWNGGTSHLFAPLAALVMIAIIALTTINLKKLKELIIENLYRRAYMGLFCGFSAMVLVFIATEHYYIDTSVYTLEFYAGAIVTWALWLISLFLSFKFSILRKSNIYVIIIASVIYSYISLSFGINIAANTQKFASNFETNRDLIKVFFFTANLITPLLLNAGVAVVLSVILMLWKKAKS